MQAPAAYPDFYPNPVSGSTCVTASAAVVECGGFSRVTYITLSCSLSIGVLLKSRWCRLEPKFLSGLAPRTNPHKRAPLMWMPTCCTWLVGYYCVDTFRHKGAFAQAACLVCAQPLSWAQSQSS